MSRASFPGDPTTDAEDLFLRAIDGLIDAPDRLKTLVDDAKKLAHHSPTLGRDAVVTGVAVAMAAVTSPFALAAYINLRLNPGSYQPQPEATTEPVDPYEPDEVRSFMQQVPRFFSEVATAGLVELKSSALKAVDKWLEQPVWSWSDDNVPPG